MGHAGKNKFLDLLPVRGYYTEYDWRMFSMWEKWTSRWDLTIQAIDRIGGDTEFHISDRATEEQVVAVEKKLGFRLPSHFRKVLLEFSSNVSVSWYLPDDFNLPDQLSEVFGGDCSWDLRRLIDIEERRQDWVKECFPDEQDDYDKVWHNKFAFMDVPNGDCIAFDMSNYPTETPVIYLSHEDGKGHGVKLGDNFEDFIDRWTQVGCPGPEDWQIMPFMSCEGIDPDIDNSKLWREVIDIQFPEN